MKMIQTAITELLPYVKSSKTMQQCCLWVEFLCLN